MIIEKVDPGRECFSDYALDGLELIIGDDVIVDLEAEESDNEVVIPFCKCNGMVHRGLMSQKQCSYVAEVIIPPRRYEDVEVEDENHVDIEDENEDEEQNTRTERIPLPLDIDSVVLRLWPVEVQPEIEEQIETTVELETGEQTETTMEGVENAE